MKVIILQVGFVYQTTFWYDITRLPLNVKHRNFTLAHPCIIFHDTVDGQYPANQLRLVVSPTGVYTSEVVVWAINSIIMTSS